MSEVEVPKVGKLKKSYVIGAVSIAGAYVLYRYYQAHQAAANAPVVTPPDSLGNDLNPTGGGAPVGSQLGVADPNATPAPLTNAQWTQAAEQYLVSVGYDPSTAAAVLGKYLDRQPLTTSEQTIVRAALAGAGSPPGGTYSVIPASSPTVADTAPPTGLHVPIKTSNYIDLAWNPVAGAAKYTLYRNGTAIYTGASTFRPDSNLVSGHTYTYAVSSYNSAGKESAKSPTISVTTNSAPAPKGGAQVTHIPTAIHENL